MIKLTIKHIGHALAAAALISGLGACSDKQAADPKTAAQVPAPSNESMAQETEFSAADAKANLRFAKEQYLKMLEHVKNKEFLHYASQQCTETDAVCWPRAMEGDEIYMERLKKWTNGFWPGVLWKLLNAQGHIDNFSEKEKSTLFEAAKFYTDALESETKRTSTHDLGFLLYDSYGEALDYPKLSEEDKQRYLSALQTGRESLATRFNDDPGLIKSWDWLPKFQVWAKTDDGMQKEVFPIKAPWPYPVIVDNMMNLEFMLTSDDPLHHQMALSHAQKTKEYHYHYLEDDAEKQRPVAYHVFDYGTMRPGNWQGMGNISAWARGQGWSLYGFISVAELAKQSSVNAEDFPDFEAFADTLYSSVAHLLREDPVPDWDFLANEDKDKTTARAANTAADTAVYSHILTLCIDRIPEDTLPYTGYEPILIDVDTDLLAAEDLEKIKKLKSMSGEPILVDGKIAPCGTKPYDLSGRAIPKDTSAAALIAAGLYRFAQFTDDSDKRRQYIALADKIMAELSTNYLTKKKADREYDLGFVLSEATGNLPSASEINKPIVYADFYFIEANMRKLALAEQE